ncbi:MAG: protein-disulfide reductase DsbD domain-containing protein [Chitinophagaceae bacterium]
MTRKLLIAAITLFISVLSIAQSNPVKWTFEAKKIADKTYEIKYLATIDAPWHIYSQTTPEGGPIATKITVSKNPLLTLDGIAKENGKLITKYEDVFGINVIYFDNKVEFVQVINLKTTAKTKINGAIQYMVCNDVQCLPPATIPFSIELK